MRTKKEMNNKKTDRNDILTFIFVRDRNLVVISNVKDKDVLWCMSSDLFPFSPTLMEAYSTIDLDGPALALSEVFSNLPI